jgi:hypothetical protein
MGLRAIPVLVVALLFVGCPRRTQETPDAAPVAAPTEAAALRPTPRDAGARAAAPKGGTIDPDAGVAYAGALKRGRAATVKKDYHSAIAAFDEALAAIPKEPRALAERGYAKLLAGDNYGARMDLWAARGRTKDEKLGSQIWWNLGLIAEREKDDSAAHDAFAHAYALHPTLAAKAKLGDAGTCPATVDAQHVKLVHHATWPSEWDDVRASCGAACLVGPAPYDAGDEANHDDSADVPYHLVVFIPGGGYDALESIVSVSPRPYGTCGVGSATVEVVDDKDPLHLQVVHIINVSQEFDHEVDDAGEDRVVGYHCGGEGSESEVLDVFIDRPKRERVLSVRQDLTGQTPAVVIKQGGGVTLAGGGCDEKRSFAARD